MIVIRETQTKEKPCLLYLPLFPIYFLMTSHMTLEGGAFDFCSPSARKGGGDKRCSKL